MAAAALLGAAWFGTAGCGGGAADSIETKTPQPRRIVLDYNNGWYHTADGRQTVRDIAMQYERTGELIAQLNQTSPGAVPPTGKMLYIPPSNNRDRVRSVLQRIQTDPSLVPKVPWRRTQTASNAESPGHKTPAAPTKRVVSHRSPIKKPIEKKQEKTAPSGSVASRAGALASLMPLTRTAKQTASSSDSKKPAGDRRSSVKTSKASKSSSGGRSKSVLDWPLEGEVITDFKPGWTDNPSHGIEIAAKEGEDIHCAAPGKVLWASDKLPGYGNLVIIDHGHGIATYYGYNKEIFVKKGDRVTENQRIASVGRPSKNSRPRLFFKVSRDAKPVDPEQFLP